MWRRRHRSGTSAPPGPSGTRSSSLDSTTTTTTTGEASQNLEEKLLRDLEKEIEEKARATHRALAQESSSSARPSSSRLWRGARKAAKKVLGIGKNSGPSSSTSAAIAPPSQEQNPASDVAGSSESPPQQNPASDVAGTSASPPQQNLASDVAGTSDSVPAATGTTGINDEARSEQQPISHTRSQFAAMMRSALAKIQDATAADAQEEAAFAEMEQAMTGLMDRSYKKVEPPKLPRHFTTRWPSDSVDRSYEQWRILPENTCPVTGQTLRNNTCPVSGNSLPHSLAVPNHLLRDMIAAWCLDHSGLPPSTTADTLPSPLIPPSEEQIQDILDKFSGRRSVLQKEALHLINQMSKTSKGVHPCLHKWPGLVPMLLDLRKKWKSSWERDAEEERISLFLNLSMHRPNREILAGQNKLPAVLIKVNEKADRLGTPPSVFAMVASTVTILSEFDVFRKRLLDTGGMKMLSDLLRIDDVVVRKETATAILALCTDEEANSSAVDNDVPVILLECFMVTDEFLLLLDRLPKSPVVLDGICGIAVELVNIVIEEQESGMVTTQGVYSAISLIFTIAQRNVSKLKVKNVKDFMKRLQKLSSMRIPMQTMIQVEEIIKTLSEMFPALTRQLQNQ